MENRVTATTTSVRLSRPQTRILAAIDRGVEVHAYARAGHEHPKNWTFSCDADGMEGPLYLSMSAWALISKGVLEVRQTAGTRWRLVRRL